MEKWLEELAESGTRVRVARNLHKETLSVRVKGKVVGYTDAVLLADAKFVVSEAGRARCLRDRKKNVHAFVEGRIVRQDEQLDLSVEPVSVSYNPYLMGSFYERETKSPVQAARYAGVYAAGAILASQQV